MKKAISPQLSAISQKKEKDRRQWAVSRKREDSRGHRAASNATTDYRTTIPGSSRQLAVMSPELMADNS